MEYLAQSGNNLFTVLAIAFFCPFDEGRYFFGKYFLAKRARTSCVHKNRECLRETSGMLDRESVLLVGKDTKDKGLKVQMVPFGKGAPSRVGRILRLLASPRLLAANAAPAL